MELDREIWVATQSHVQAQLHGFEHFVEAVTSDDAAMGRSSILGDL